MNDSNKNNNINKNEVVTGKTTHHDMDQIRNVKEEQQQYDKEKQEGNNTNVVRTYQQQPSLSKEETTSTSNKTTTKIETITSIFDEYVDDDIYPIQESFSSSMNNSTNQGFPNQSSPVILGRRTINPSGSSSSKHSPIHKKQPHKPPKSPKKKTSILPMILQRSLLSRALSSSTNTTSNTPILSNNNNKNSHYQTNTNNNNQTNVIYNNNNDNRKDYNNEHSYYNYDYYINNNNSKSKPIGNIEYDIDDDETDGIDVLGVDFGEHPPPTHTIWSLEYVRWQACKVVTTYWFRRIRLALILLCCLLLGIRTVLNSAHLSSASSTEGSLLYFYIGIVNHTIFILQCVFCIEIGIDVAYYQDSVLQNGWIVLDVIILSIVWFWTIVRGNLSASSILIMRGFRLIRALRKSPHLQSTVVTLFRVIPRVVSVFILWLIQFYMFSVLCTDLFQALMIQSNDNSSGWNVDNDVDYFSRLDKSALTLFQIMTGGILWSTISNDIMEYYQSAWIVFVLYCWISIILFGSLFIGVVCDAVITTTSTSKEERILQSLTTTTDDHDNHNNNNNNSSNMTNANMIMNTNDKYQQQHHHHHNQSVNSFPSTAKHTNHVSLSYNNHNNNSFSSKTSKKILLPHNATITLNSNSYNNRKFFVSDNNENFNHSNTPTAKSLETSVVDDFTEKNHTSIAFSALEPSVQYSLYEDHDDPHHHHRPMIHSSSSFQQQQQHLLHGNVSVKPTIHNDSTTTMMVEEPTETSLDWQVLQQQQQQRTVGIFPTQRQSYHSINNTNNNSISTIPSITPPTIATDAVSKHDWIRMERKVDDLTNTIEQMMKTIYQLQQQLVVTQQEHNENNTNNNNNTNIAKNNRSEKKLVSSVLDQNDTVKAMENNVKDVEKNDDDDDDDDEDDNEKESTKFQMLVLKHIEQQRTKKARMKKKQNEKQQQQQQENEQSFT